jgi:hypothetical protein
MKALFISEQTLLDNSVINENVSFTQIRPTIVKVQEMRIQPIVGSALYSEMVTQVVSGTTTALNTTLLEDYIQPAMVQWLYYELPMVLAFKYMNKGMVRRTSEESSQMSMDEITRLTDKVKNDAESVFRAHHPLPHGAKGKLPALRTHRHRLLEYYLPERNQLQHRDGLGRKNPAPWCWT